MTTHVYCPCGHEFDVESEGVIMGPTVAAKIKRVPCPKCGRAHSETVPVNASRHAEVQITQVSPQRVAMAMKEYGGGFVAALGEALLHADEINTGRIKLAFPEYWDEYTELARG